jgi:hypothetical protein
VTSRNQGTFSREDRRQDPGNEVGKIIDKMVGFRRGAVAFLTLSAKLRNIYHDFYRRDINKKYLAILDSLVLLFYDRYVHCAVFPVHREPRLLVLIIILRCCYEHFN